MVKANNYLAFFGANENLIGKSAIEKKADKTMKDLIAKLARQRKEAASAARAEAAAEENDDDNGDQI